MKKGQQISFSNLNSPIQLKQLNDVINYILNSLSSRLDADSAYMQYICAKAVLCTTAGQWFDVEFDKAFYEEPILFAYSPDGMNVILRQNPNDSDMKKRVQVSFSDTTKTGTVCVAAIGKIKV